MARVSAVSDKTILDVVKSARNLKWTAQQAAASITIGSAVDEKTGKTIPVTMSVGTLRSRVNSLKELMKKQGQTKYVKILETCFVDGRGRNPSTKNPQEAVDLFASMFDGLDDIDEVDDVSDENAEVETPQTEASLELN